ncbi:MAG TPA: ABC transporter permease [Candidatus Limnocylindrales bacterium]|jgi:peptide/nickel transport system permease protein|nr:ABC transporter permease [Candidatus Limnocylindrales bacterium]
MTTFIVRRLLISVPVFLGITILVFTFIALAPGNIADALIRPELGANEEARQAIIRRFGLDQPLHIRYLSWLANAVQGDLGYRATSGQPVSGEVLRGLGASVILTGTAMLLGIFVGIPLGVLSAVRQYSKLDFLLTGITFLGISLPSFLLGLGGLWLIGLQLRLVPISGMVTVGKPFEVVDFLRHLALPALILGFGYMAIFLRYTRASMLDIIHSDYITTARSKGLSESIVLSRHAFRNGLIPVITIIGLSIPEIIGAAVVTETVFTWPGLGQMMLEGVAQRDFLLIMGITILLATVVLLANLATDVAYGYADPRIRYR